MSDGAGLLRLTQWLSPGFPISAYAYSHGLEAAISAGEVGDAAGLSAWLDGVLRAGSGRNDAILLCLAMTGAEPVCALDEVAAALAGSAERLEETRAQGAAFEATLAAMGPGASVGAGGARRAYPVAVGLAARRLDLAPALVARLFVHGFAANLVSAAVRFVPLGQAEGQRVLAGLHRTVGTVADAAARAGIEDLGGAAAGADLAAMAHESLEVRIFRT